MGLTAVLWSSGLRSEPRDKTLGVFRARRSPGQVESPFAPAAQMGTRRPGEVSCLRSL